MLYRSFLCFLTVALFLNIYACTKHSNDKHEDVPQARLVFLSPTEGASFPSGDTVVIKATAIAPKEIRGYELVIRKATDTMVIYHLSRVHEHNDTLQIEHQWKNVLPTSTALEAIITLHLDHDGNTKREKVGFWAH